MANTASNAVGSCRTRESQHMNRQMILMLVTETSPATKNDARLRELERMYAGTPGCSGFDDQWGRKLDCPRRFGQN